MHRLILVFLFALIAGCSSTATGPVTTFRYQISPDVESGKHPIRNVVLASTSFGKPPRIYLSKRKPYVDRQVKQYLTEHGINVLPDNLFNKAWDNAVRRYGSPFDPSTGRVNETTLQQVLVDALADLKANSKADAIVFADLIEVQTAFSGSVQRMAQWHGVSRKPRLQGTGEGVPADFNWAAPVDAVSLWVNVIATNQQIVFQSAGGIELAQAVDLKASKPRFVRARTILENDDFIEEGIQLAFHPLVPMRSYPGLPPAKP